ncbi:hypothetical protein AUEXF2481DRAFT_9160 [Aureobasidium subglaciale EXF-2481]|uniref:Uncharacterized protein n=1 Tax=Aureobasidium subglaciale (strain EXF-2481) TaxID=1043005 RepID=A0A074XZ72_AURSE|nr:uncharacterized protein AUEXF2481DRAFT_9160 [Aureobasidium subglaciale EXF-2481]KAI5206557.1 hypothetical protein E4T38_03763 [Aureobasidium subglaciale]KAI5224959.1 hypothetical protein E4T41_05511 [Aureobasidium subglaciale]KAI5225359.1 hypothetical protein E4T40_03538 [Aureobasidium subglaciale]KAI5261202.1 hypothetical protein E4T46_05404 [Aureobasidium subglaciale]KEQ90735.1 hypothetical protein AUEXF2481DRAFT_9160 [Aureobasidium subglaciale EXF-2481]
MNPQAPHYKYNTPAPSGNNGTRNGSNLATIFGSLRTTFVPASVPTTNSTRGTSTPHRETPNQTPTPTPTTQSHSLVKFEPRMSSNEELFERARVEQQEQSQLLLHSKLLRLTEQVDELMNQRAAFEEKQTEGAQIINDLRGEVLQLKTQVKSQNDKLGILKGLSDDHIREHKALAQHLKEMPGNLDALLRYTVTRIDRVETVVRGVEFQVGNQIKQHATQLRDNDKRIVELEQCSSHDMKDYNGSMSQENIQPRSSGSDTNHSASIEKLEKTQVTHTSYLETIGQSLIANQNSITVAEHTMNDLLIKLDDLKSANAEIRSHQQADPGLFKMDATTDAISKLQTQVERLARSVQHKTATVAAEIPQGNDSSADDVERLVIQMDEVRSKIGGMQEELNTQIEMRNIMDECATASKVRLETMFYQLTKELMHTCEPEHIEFGLDEERTFIVRQRVLERLTIENGVQLEFERLQQSQLMPR